MHNEDLASRPATPGSPLTSSLHHATATIDDLTMALVNFSRVPSPEPPNLLVCCCGREECENALSWLECKSRLESRLTLSGEVGQALLQRHEAYVRQHEGRESRQVSPRKPRISHSSYIPSSPEATSLDLIELVKEKTILEKRLNQALVNNEVTEVSNKTIIQELQEARATISRLTAQHARSVGWETRLSAAILEKDDMQQERDSESHRAKLAESRLATMKDKAAKLQSEVRRLQDALEERRQHRLESSETILQDARARLESLYNSLNSSALADQTELMDVLESLVNDNETLKRDNAELQHLLTESREEIHSLQEEVEEQRAILPSRGGAGTPHLRPSVYANSVSSSLLQEHSLPKYPRSASVDRKPRRPFELLTPETSQRPLSPADSTDSRWLPFNQPHSHYSSSHVSFEVDESVNNDEGSSFPEKPKTHKTLLLLTRSRAVQTETWPGLLSPTSLPPYNSSSSPHDPRSESSSFSESPPSNLSVLLERITALNNRLVQADALTLTNRLKRQHLKGADVGHLSRSTVNNILSETTGLRAQFRFLLEDESIVTSCTRKDFRVLFKLFKDIFTEMGQMRITLNDIILDPAQAPKISELALDPSKGETERREKERENTGAPAASSWMAPISKLFSPGGRSEHGSEERTRLLRSVSGRGTSRPPRFVPKLGPALSASATTVNVEFSGTGVGRSTTTSTAASPAALKVETPEVSSVSQGPSPGPGVMGIFAGAPRAEVPDPWVVVPKGPRRVQSFMKPKDVYSPATIRRSSTKSGHGGSSGLSRDVDAVIDVERPLETDEEPDYLAPLLERTLRRRGLSDSSIHSTFTNQADDTRPSVIGVPAGESTRPDRASVFEALSRTVQNFRMTTSGTEASAAGSSSGSAGATLSPRKPSAAERAKPAAVARTTGPGLHAFLPNLSSWAAAGSMLDPVAGAEPFLVGSVRGESLVRRTRRAGESHGHEYF